MMTQVTGSEVQQAERHSGSPPATDNLLMVAHCNDDDDDNDGDNYEEQENVFYEDAGWKKQMSTQGHYQSIYGCISC